jgi:SAM-dependent methyltransferase
VILRQAETKGTRSQNMSRPTHALFEPSPLVRRFASKIVNAAAGKPVIDVACGSGRNAILLSQLGCAVICVDKDLSLLQTQQQRLSGTLLGRALAQLTLNQMDLLKDPWPFGGGTLGGVVNIHFLLPALFPFFESSLSPGGYLLVGTVPACGGNYLQLPKKGELKMALAKAFDFEFYKEGKAGPRGYDAVTVQLLAKRRE